jgi:hypothetical protein
MTKEQQENLTTKLREILEQTQTYQRQNDEDPEECAWRARAALFVATVQALTSLAALSFPPARNLSHPEREALRQGLEEARR